MMSLNASGSCNGVVKKKNTRKGSHLIPMLDSKDLWMDKTQIRGKEHQKVTRRIVGTVDLTCGKNDSNSAGTSGISFLVCFISYQYVKSRSDQQLRNRNHENDTSTCKPEDVQKGRTVVPCVLVAWSMFNYTFIFATNNNQPLSVKKEVFHGKVTGIISLENMSSSSGLRKRAWVQIALMTYLIFYICLFLKD
ncbi:ALA-interacting subunit 3-like protein [Tanacetum coccineum]